MVASLLHYSQMGDLVAGLDQILECFLSNRSGGGAAEREGESLGVPYGGLEAIARFNRGAVSVSVLAHNFLPCVVFIRG